MKAKFFASVASLTLAGAAQAQSVSRFEIPIAGGSRFLVTDLSTDGSIVSGYYRDNLGLWSGFIFDRITNRVTELGEITGDWKGVLISDDGTVAAAQMWNGLSRWTMASQTWETDPQLAGGCPGPSSAHDMSADGNHIVGLRWDGCFADAYHWDYAGAGVQIIEGIRAAAISDDGTTITGFDQQGQRVWANWDNHVMSWPTIADPGEGQTISGDGQYMGGMQFRNAVRYTAAGGFEVLGPAVYVWQMADDGQSMLVRGGVSGNLSSLDISYWTPTSGVVKLENYLGAAFTGWSFSFAPYAQMSDDGSTIIGTGTDPNGGGELILIEFGNGCPCACDFDTSTGNGVCDIFDFLAFQNSFVGAETCACDIDTSTGNGTCDIFDFLAFQDEFVSGCP